MKAEERLALVSEKEKEQSRLTQVTDSFQQQVDTLQAEIETEQDTLKALNKTFGAKTAAHTTADKEFKAIDTQYAMQQSGLRAAKRAQATMDSDRESDLKHEKILEAAKLALETDNYNGDAWYFPRRFSVETVFSCFSQDELSRDERERLRAGAKQSASYHGGGISSWVTSARLAGEDEDTSPRKALFDKIELKLAALEAKIILNASNGPAYISASKAVTERQVLVNQACPEHEEAEARAQEARQAFEGARSLYQAKTTEIDVKKERIKRLEVTISLYDMYIKPFNKKLYVTLKSFDVVNPFVSLFDSPSEKGLDDDSLELQALLNSLRENEEMLNDAVAIQAAYDELDFAGETGFYERFYADDELNLIEEEEELTSFRDKTLEIHKAHCDKIPSLIKALQTRKKAIAGQIKPLQQEIKRKAEQANIRRIELADKYLPKASRVEQQEISGVSNLGRLDSYMQQRNTTYHSWDMFASFVKWLVNGLSVFAFCPCVPGYEPEKEIRETYVTNVKGAVSTWRDSNDSTRLSDLLGQQGQFKERSGGEDLQTLQSNMRALQTDLEEVNTMMPDASELALANQNIATH